VSAEIDVLVLGGAGVDTVVYVDELPLPFADSYHVPPIVTRAGQTGDGVAVGVQALGLRTHHLDVVGDDHEGALVEALHRRCGVAFTAVRSAAGTRRAVNLVARDGRRLSLYDGSRAADVDGFPEALLAGLVARSRHAHVSITPPCASALPALLEAGLSISTDLHDWDGRNAYHRPFADAADLVFLSAAALADPERTMHDNVERGRAGVVVATAGADGAVLLTRDGALRRVDAVRPPAEVVDTNGAGDAFVAGYLFGHLRGEDVERCALFGALAAAHACTVPSTDVHPIARETLLARASAAPGGGTAP
jgi:sugar/nucleoside kinase (ribokinase family)